MVDSSAPAQGTENEVRLVGGKKRLLQHRFQQGPWVPAVYHSDVFSSMLEADDKNGSYVCPRASGKKAEDRTSYLASQHYWGEDTIHRPDILYQIKPTDDCEGYVPSDFLKHDGKVVLASDNRRIVNYPELPRTISTHLEGWHFETIKRLNNAISYEDVKARILPADQIHEDDVFPERNALNMRRLRYRRKTGSVSWISRQNTDADTEAILGVMGDTYLQANSTKGRADIPLDKIRKLWEEKKQTMAASGNEESSASKAPQSKGESSKLKASDVATYSDDAAESSNISARVKKRRADRPASDEEEDPLDTLVLAQHGDPASTTRDEYRTANTFIFTSNATDWATGWFSQGDTKLTMSVHEDDDPRKDWRSNAPITITRAFQRGHEFDSSIREGKWMSMAPRNTEELHLILDALSPTLDAYRTLTLRKEPQYQQTDSYDVMFARLQEEFEKYDRHQGRVKLPRLNLVSAQYVVWSLGEAGFALDTGDLADRMKVGLCEDA